MKISNRRKQSRRAAFTLIEVLVTMAIIAILVGTILGAVMYMLNKGPEAVTRADISNMDTGLQGLKTQYDGIKYLPSRLKLSPTNNYYNPPNSTTPATPLDKASVAFLSAMFGRRLSLAHTGGVVHNWSGTGSATDMILEGEECLVFYLGGVPQVGGGGIMMTGFNPDNSNPTAQAAAGVTRNGPYFPFKSNRFSTGPSGFPVYLDGWGTAYAFFSGGPAGNDYNGTSSDCQTLTKNAGNPTGTLPYYTQSGTVTQFINPNSFQIISAGPDKIFSPGGLWVPATGTPGSDDMSNFSKGKLGNPQS